MTLYSSPSKSIEFKQLHRRLLAFFSQYSAACSSKCSGFILAFVFATFILQSPAYSAVAASSIFPDLSEFKITYPVDINGKDYTDVSYEDRDDPGRRSYEIPNDNASVHSLTNYIPLAPFAEYFYVEGTEVVFRAHVAGALTSINSYPRCELRQRILKSGKDGSGADDYDGYWLFDDEHELNVTLRITHLPVVKPEVCVLQIKGSSDEAFRLEYREDSQKLHITVNESETREEIMDYTLGDFIQARLYVNDGSITIKLKNLSQTTGDNEYTTTYPSNYDEGYFKVGCYPQSSQWEEKNGVGDEEPDAYAEVRFCALWLDSLEDPQNPLNIISSNKTLTQEDMTIEAELSTPSPVAVYCVWDVVDHGENLNDWPNRELMPCKHEGTIAFTPPSLEVGTTYFVRWFATSHQGEQWSTVSQFNTPFDLEMLEIQDATSINQGSAQLHAKLTSNSPVDVYFVWDTTDHGAGSNLWTHRSSLLNENSGLLELPITDLAADTTYFFRGYAMLPDGVQWTDVLEFKTLPANEILRIQPASDVSSQIAKLNVELTTDSPITVHFVWDTSDKGTNLAQWNHHDDLQNQTTGNLDFDIDGLIPETNYTYRCYLELSDGGYLWSDAETFTTLPFVPPSIQITGFNKTLTHQDSTIYAELTTSSPTTVYCVWDKADYGPNLTGWQNSYTFQYQSSETIIIAPQNLSSDTTYFVRWFAFSQEDSVWSEIAYFTTPKALGPPVLRIENAIEITSTSATLLANLDTANPAETTIYWGEQDFGTNDSDWPYDVPLGNQTTGLLSSTVHNLQAEVTYFYRYFASNEDGSTWSEARSFTTYPNEPFNKLENFENRQYLDSIVGQGDWGGNTSESDEFHVKRDSGNYFLKYNKGNNEVYLACDSPCIPDDSIATVFCRVKTRSSTHPNSALGLVMTMSYELSPSEFDHGETDILFDEDDTGIKITGGTKLDSDLWYYLWIVVNNIDDTYDVYLQPSDGSQTRIVSGEPFKNGQASRDLMTIMLKAKEIPGKDPQGDFWVDDICIANGFDAHNHNPLPIDSDNDGLIDTWEIEHFGDLTTTSGDPHEDFDEDGMSDAAEYLAGTTPTDNGSFLTICEISKNTSSNKVSIIWTSEEGKIYRILTSYDLKTWNVASPGILGTPPENNYEIPAAVKTQFLKVGIEP